MNDRRRVHTNGPDLSPAEVRKPSVYISLVLLFLALVFVVAAVLGYVYFDPYVTEHMSMFFCAIPMGFLSLLSLVLAVLLRRLRIRRSVPAVPGFAVSRPDVPPDMMEKKRDALVENMKEKRRETLRFLKDIREQHEEGLLSDNTYATLERDYGVQLRIIEQTLDRLGGDTDARPGVGEKKRRKRRERGMVKTGKESLGRGADAEETDITSVEREKAEAPKKK